VAVRLLDRRDEPLLRLMLQEADRWRLPVDAPRPPLTEILSLNVVPDNPARGLHDSQDLLKVADVEASWRMLLSPGFGT